MCGSGSIAPSNRTNPSSTRTRERDFVAPIMVVAPSMEVARYEPKFRRDGARDTPRATIASPVSGKDLVSPSILRSQRTTAGMGPGLFLVLHPIPTAESVLHLAGRFFPPGIDPGNHPMVANVSSTALQRFTPWVCVAAPRDHARTWTASYSKLAPSLKRFGPKPYFHEADCLPRTG